MMIAINFLVCQKEGAQGEEGEEAGGRRKAGSETEIDLLIGYLIMCF